jgi:malic enzyme
MDPDWRTEHIIHLAFDCWLWCRVVESTKKDISGVLDTAKSFDSVLKSYSYLSQVQEKEPELFFAALKSYPEDLLPIIYTPGVGEACKNWGKLESKPPGLTLSFKSDQGRLAEKLRRFASGREIQVVVVTDGE